jgi:hypothetical protein
LKRFELEEIGDITRSGADDHVTVHLRSTALSSSSGESTLKFEVCQDGERVVKLGSIFGVSVHTWAISEDLSYFEHGHGQMLDDGLIEARFRFPSPGHYSVYIQPAVVPRSGRGVATVHRFGVAQSSMTSRLDVTGLSGRCSHEPQEHSRMLSAKDGYEPAQRGAGP